MTIILCILFFIFISVLFAVGVHLTRCRHDYVVYKSVYVPGSNSTPTRICIVYMCRKCGKLKTETMDM